MIFFSAVPLNIKNSSWAAFETSVFLTDFRDVSSYPTDLNFLQLIIILSLFAGPECLNSVGKIF